MGNEPKTEALSGTPILFPSEFYSTRERLATKKKVSTAWVIHETVENYVSEQWPLFSDLIEEEPSGVCWRTEAKTKRLLDMMSVVNRRNYGRPKKAGRRVVGAVYKRTRVDETGGRAQRAEIQFDDIAGCLRTPVGAASRPREALTA